MDRYQRLYSQQDMGTDNLKEMIQSITKPKKNRCLVKRGGHYEYVDVSDIAYVNSEDSITFLHTSDGQRHIYGKTVESLFNELDENQFYQINRSQIVNVNAVHQIHPYLNQRLKVIVQPNLKAKCDFIVSRNRMMNFKDWLDQ